MATKRGMMDQFWDIKNEHPDTVLFLEWVIFMNCSMKMQ